MKSWLLVALVLAVGIVDISAHIEAKRNYCRTHACQQGEQMAKLYADESAVIGAPCRRG